MLPHHLASKQAGFPPKFWKLARWKIYWSSTQVCLCTGRVWDEIPLQVSSATRNSSTPRNEGEQVERREPRRTVKFQEQLDIIEKRRQTEPPLQSSIRSNRKNLKKQNMVHFQNNSRSKRNKKRNRMLGKHVGLHGKRGCWPSLQNFKIRRRRGIRRRV